MSVAERVSSIEELNPDGGLGDVDRSVSRRGFGTAVAASVLMVS